MLLVTCTKPKITFLLVRYLTAHGGWHAMGNLGDCLCALPPLSLAKRAGLLYYSPVDPRQEL